VVAKYNPENDKKIRDYYLRRKGIPQDKLDKMKEDGVAEGRGNPEAISKNKLVHLLKIAVANSNDRREYALMTQAKEMFGDNWADDAYEYAALHNQNLNSDTFLDANNEQMQELAGRLGIKHSDYSSTPGVTETTSSAGMATAPGVGESTLTANTPDPIVVVQDRKGNILDTVNLSAAVQKYRLGNAQNIKNQLAHQNYTTIGNYVVMAPMGGQPQDKTTQGIAENTNYWHKLQAERNTRINSLITELKESIK
jgi:hypothetical protein